jgi:hypothetical protein
METGSMLKQLALVGASAVLFAGLPCKASVLTNNGYFNGYEIFHVISPDAEGDFGAGGFRGTFDPGGGPSLAYYFWCIELSQYFSPNTTYTDGYFAIDLGTGNKYSALFTLVGGSERALANTETSAAFQLAVWDLRYDGGDGLGIGGFRVTAGDQNAINDANAWLSILGSSGRFDVVKFYSRENQDFISDRNPPRQQVPEPSTVPLVILAFSALAVAIRNRRRKYA